MTTWTRARRVPSAQMVPTLLPGQQPVAHALQGKVTPTQMPPQHAHRALAANNITLSQAESVAAMSASLDAMHLHLRTWPLMTARSVQLDSMQLTDRRRAHPVLPARPTKIAIRQLLAAPARTACTQAAVAQNAGSARQARVTPTSTPRLPVSIVYQGSTGSMSLIRSLQLIRSSLELALDPSTTNIAACIDCLAGQADSTGVLRVLWLSVQ
jgi:hypothetical protein